jgi:hypothetical protein
MTPDAARDARTSLLFLLANPGPGIAAYLPRYTSTDAITGTVIFAALLVNLQVTPSPLNWRKNARP